MPRFGPVKGRRLIHTLTRVTSVETFSPGSCGRPELTEMNRSGFEGCRTN